MRSSGRGRNSTRTRFSRRNYPLADRAGCQRPPEKSQHRNREIAMQVLSRVYNDMERQLGRWVSVLPKPAASSGLRGIARNGFRTL